MRAGLTFKTEGNPIPKQSTRFDGAGRAHTDPRITAWQEAVAWAAKEAIAEYPDWQIFTGSLHVIIHFSRSNRHRVDLDNLSKAVLDSLNGLVFVDDNQVVILHITKNFSDTPGISVMIYEVEA